MPSCHCAIVGCTANATRNRGLSFFRVRRPDNEEWENALVRAVNRVDKGFNKESAVICSRHFQEKCINVSTTNTSRGFIRTLITGSLPTENMPLKSIESSGLPERKPPKERTPPTIPQVVRYYTFQEVMKAASAAMPEPWTLIHKSDEKIIFATFTENFEVNLKVCIEPNFKATVFCRGIQANDLTCSVESISVKELLTSFSSLHFCNGIEDQELQDLAELSIDITKCMYYRHVVIFTDKDNFICKSTVKSLKCKILIREQNALCNECTQTKQQLIKKLKRSQISETKGISTNTPLNTVSNTKLTVELKKIRKENAKLKKEVTRFKRELNEDSILISSTLHESMLKVMQNDADTNMDSLQRLFWTEQIKAFKCKGKGMRWHPMMLRLAILIHGRSPAAYETLRATGVLNLPGESTLRDYTNVYHPKAGFNRHVIDEILKTVKDYKDHERFVHLMHDEMTIKADLVFDKRSGELVGFINDGETSKNCLATHVMVFYITGINTPLSMSIGCFGTQSITADNLFPLFWRAVGLLETECNLKVISAVCDKASPNQRLYDIHGDSESIAYKTTNLFARDRCIYFFSDVPHLIKTIRNNLSNSGAGKRSRYLWNKEKHLLWEHIVDIYNKDTVGHLRKTKLTSDHIYLTPTSTMNVKLAVQTLSFSVGKSMQISGGAESDETANFILNMDRFFDCLNGHSLEEGTESRKNDLNPYTNVDDERFSFLDNFLTYLIEWKKCCIFKAW